MEWLNIIITFISVIISGSIISIFTIREQRKAAMLANKEKEEEIKDKNDSRWERIADQLSDQCEKLNNQISELNERLDKKDALLEEKNDIISDLKERLDKTRSKYIASDACRCIRISCPDREPSWGSRMLDVDRVVAESEN